MCNICSLSHETPNVMRVSAEDLAKEVFDAFAMAADSRGHAHLAWWVKKVSGRISSVEYGQFHSLFTLCRLMSQGPDWSNCVDHTVWLLLLRKHPDALLDRRLAVLAGEVVSVAPVDHPDPQLVDFWQDLVDTLHGVVEKNDVLVFGDCIDLPWWHRSKFPVTVAIELVEKRRRQFR